MKRFIAAVFILCVISAYGSPAIADCGKDKWMCERACTDARNKSACKSCCKVTYYNCLPPEGKESVGGTEYLATHEAKCGMQCEKAQENEWNKALHVWGPYNPSRNPFASNHPPSLLNAQSCLDTAHAQCIASSTQTFPIGVRCCIAKSCSQLANEVLDTKSSKCRGGPVQRRFCSDAAKKSSEHALQQCRSKYPLCISESLTSAPSKKRILSK